MSRTQSNKPPAAGVCSPLNLVELASPKYAAFLRSNCMTNRLKTQRGEEITILIPDDKRLAQMEKITDPKELIDEVHSLLIPQRIASLAEFVDGFINKKGDKITVSKAAAKEAVLDNGCKITALDYKIRGPFFIAYSISGTAKLSGEQASEKEKTPKKGGMMMLSGPLSYVQLVQKKVESHYRAPFSSDGKNIYFKKVVLQLRILKKNSPDLFSSGQIARHLGNEEVSTSYLLDRITSAHCAGILWTALGEDGPLPERMSSIGFAEFAAEYSAAVAESKPGYAAPISVDQQSTSFRDVRSHLDARVLCSSLYGTDAARLGKDIFILFTNYQKYAWLKDRKKCLDQGGSMEHLSNDEYDSFVNYVKWCGDFADRASRAPNMQDDFRDFVGLIKTDVLLFTPGPIAAATPFVDTKGFAIVQGELPGLVDRSLFSMNEYMARLSSTGGIYLGGGSSRQSKIDEVLREYV